MEPLRRRNGRPQACDPCRKRKVACDHAYPTCRRCTTRNIDKQCVYMISPSSLPRKISRSNPISQSPQPMNRTSNTVSSANAARQVSEASYLGFTSFSTVYQETQSSLTLVHGSSTSPINNPNVSTAPGPGTALSPSYLEKCLNVLQLIPDEETGRSLFEKEINPNSGWIRPAARKLVESLYVTFKEPLNSKGYLSLQVMARLISANTSKPWIEDESDSGLWTTSFCGRNIRWECIGILFSYWFFAINSTKPHGTNKRSTENDQNIANKELTFTFKEGIELCIELCKGQAPNSLLLCLLYKGCIAESIVSGDTSSFMWRRYAEVLALAIHLGMHAVTPCNHYIPSASSEAKRRLMAQIFKIDKLGASFCGRPPLLHRKYLLTPLPLDISDDVLLSDPETIRKAVDSLDEEGWNSDGKIYPTTILRARVHLAHIRDEVMENALSKPEFSSVEDLLYLESRELDTMAALPPTLKYKPDDLRDASVDRTTLYSKLFVHLEHLQNLFLIRRLLVQRRHSESHTELLRLSYDMVSITVLFWTHMDKLAGLHGNLDWFVMAYAAPAGGILCNELLMPSLQINPIFGVTRSGIIQQLSLLIGFLDWVGPLSPNGDICSSCKAVIEHVLDHSLNTPVDLSNAKSDTNDFILDFSSDLNNYFSFELLDTFDWLRPEASLSDTR